MKKGYINKKATDKLNLSLSVAFVLDHFYFCNVPFNSAVLAAITSINAGDNTS